MAAPLMTNRREMPTEFRRRLTAAMAVVLVVFGVTLVRLWSLQITEGERYRSLSEHNRIRLKRVHATRGVILDRNGEVLVDNRPSFDLVLVPEDAVVRIDGRPGVFVLERDVARFTELVLGERKGGRVAVVQGLSGGEDVVLEPPRSLKSGDRVRILEG